MTFFAGGRGLTLFLCAGDPGFRVLEDVVVALDAEGVDCLELAVPFPNSVTDGPVIRRSAERALRRGTDLDATLAFVAGVRPRLERLRLVLLADWRHTVRRLDLDDFLGRVRRSEADGLLLHGLPPAVRLRYYDRAARAGQPIVTTCYASSPPDVLAESAAHATAFLYVVSHFGRSESVPGPRAELLAPVLAHAREHTEAPIAVGFGIRDADDVRTVWDAGADAAIVGSAGVARLEGATDPVGEIVGMARELGLARETTKWGDGHVGAQAV